MNRKRVEVIASILDARQTCAKTNNKEWFDKHTEKLKEIMDDAPSGSGIDSGTELDLIESKPDRLVFNFSYHHMNDAGFYDGWTDHKLIVKPSFVLGVDMRITGSDRNDIKDYLYQVYELFLSEVIEA